MIRPVNFSQLRPVEPPDPLEQYKQVLGIRGQQLQQQDVQAQIQERQATAQDKQRQLAAHQKISEAIQQSVDPATGQVDWDKASSAVMGIDPAVGQNLAVHAANMRKQTADIQKGEAETKLHEDTLTETKSKNAAEELEKRLTRERQAAEDRAGSLIPGTEFTTNRGERAAQFKVLQPDGRYTNETRVLGKQGAAPTAPTPPLSPERFTQEETLKQEGKTPTEVPDLNDIVETTRSGRKYVPVSNLTSKQKESINTQASKAGITVVDKDVAEMLRDLDTARANQEFMLQAIESKLPKDAAGRVVIGPKNRLTQISQLDPDLAATGTFRNAAIQSMRALAGSRGLRINQVEILMAVENDIPKPTDTVETARKKLKDIFALLDNTEKAHLERNRASGGNRVTATNPQTGAQVESLDGGKTWQPVKK